MTTWRYRTIDLADLPSGVDAVEKLFNDAGGEGWEVTENGVAYLWQPDEEAEEAKPTPIVRATPTGRRRRGDGKTEVCGGGSPMTTPIAVLAAHWSPSRSFIGV
jgi:hypothetical protein